MRTIVFNQGFNRVEHHQIICLECAKLNRLLDEERRITETLAASVKRRIETTAPKSVADVQTVWEDIQNHSLLKAARERINLLTHAYPQFLNQVETARQRLKKRIIEALEIAKYSALMTAVYH